MLKKLSALRSKTLWFAFNWAAYFILLIATFVYSYARLDFVRTTPPPIENVKQT